MTLIELQQYSKSNHSTWVSFKSFTKELTKELTTKITFHKRSENKKTQSYICHIHINIITKESNLIGYMYINTIYLTLKTKQN